MSWCIYKHTSPTGKCYIGQTSKEPEARWANGKGYKTQFLFNLAITLWGWQNFTHEILEENIPTLQEANQREKYWIHVYNAYLNGYNMRAQTGGSADFRCRAYLLGSHFLMLINAKKQYKSGMKTVIKFFNLKTGYDLDNKLEQDYQAFLQKNHGIVPMI